MTVRILNIAVLLVVLVLPRCWSRSFFTQPRIPSTGLRERNIPLDELPVRAQNELPLDHTIVIYSTDPSEADLAYSILDTQGFAHVFVLVSNPTQAPKQSQ